MRDKFGATMGVCTSDRSARHPDWSCQLAFGPEKLGDVVGSLALNRGGLVALVDPRQVTPSHQARELVGGDQASGRDGLQNG